MINARLISYLHLHNHLDRCQSGFRPRHSSLDALTRLDYTIRHSFIRHEHVICVFLDITQAFDSVNHTLLLRKLSSIGLTGNLLAFIHNFLSNRKLQVRVPGALSAPHMVPHGVPQGSVLSPTLFLLMINAIFHTCPPGINYSLFADDCALWASGSDPATTVALLQSSLDAVHTYTTTWGLSLSPAKSKAMYFSHSRSLPPPLTLNNTPLAYVPSYKFLGVIFDRRYTFRHHILSLRDRCSRDLQLLRIVAGNCWGSDFTTLRTLYTTLTRSKIDYASFLYSFAAPSNLLVVDRIQYAAVRILLGALRCTPVISLEAEANLMPLSLRRRLLLTQYITRVLTVPSHPVRRLFLDYYPFQFSRAQSRPLSAIAVAYDSLHDAHIDPTHIPTSTLCPCIFSSLPVHFSLHTHTKSTLPSTSWRSLFLDLLSTYDTRTAVYCDGSRDGGRTGSGVTSGAVSIMARLSDHSSVLTAELYAIYTALTYFSTCPGSYIIFTDSLSSILALRAPHSRSHYLVLRIASLLVSSAKFILEWVPAHVGIPGNEKADALARSSLTLSRISSHSLTSHELRPLLHDHYHHIWQAQWSASPSRLLPIMPTLVDSVHLSLPRSPQIILSRLRLGACRLTHSHHFTNTPPTLCPSCHVPWSISHLLVSCPALHASRTTLIRLCRTHNAPLSLVTLLSEDFVSDALLQFLRTTGFATAI